MTQTSCSSIEVVFPSCSPEKINSVISPLLPVVLQGNSFLFEGGLSTSSLIKELKLDEGSVHFVVVVGVNGLALA